MTNSGSPTAIGAGQVLSAFAGRPGRWLAAPCDPRSDRGGRKCRPRAWVWDRPRGSPISARPATLVIPMVSAFG